IYLGYKLVHETYFEERVRNFITNELNFPDTQLLTKTITNTEHGKELKVVLLGETVPDVMIENARYKLPRYGLKDLSLVVQQGFGQEGTDINELKSLLLQDLYKNSEEVLRIQSYQIDSLKRTVQRYEDHSRMASQLIPEIRVLFPYVQDISCSDTYIIHLDSVRQDTVLMVYVKARRKLKEQERDVLREWLAARNQTNNIKLLID
ncbi:MAG: TIGR00341 family protein, partial [Tannerellaceae bacterium]|nr:TIGR00341 family protein [Tannerellaceae bacterium]